MDEIHQRDNKIRALEGAKAHLVQNLVEARRALGVGAAVTSEPPQVAIPEQLRRSPRRKETEIEARVESKVHDVIAIETTSRHGSSSNNSAVVDGDLDSSVADKKEEVVFGSDNSVRAFVVSGQGGGGSTDEACSDTREVRPQELEIMDRQSPDAERKCIDERPDASGTSHPPHRLTTHGKLERPREGSSVSAMSASKRVSWVAEDVSQLEVPVVRKKLAPEPEGGTARGHSFSYPVHGNRVTIKPTPATTSPGEEGQHPQDKAGNGLSKTEDKHQDARQHICQHPTGKSPSDRVLGDHHQPQQEEKQDEAIGELRVTVFPPQPPLPLRPDTTEDSGDGKGDTPPLRPRRPSDLGGLSPPSQTTCFDISTPTGTTTRPSRADTIADRDQASQALRPADKVQVTNGPLQQLGADSDSKRGVGHQETQDRVAVGQHGLRGKKISNVPKPRLLSGVPVLKRGSGRGNAKGKVLWVSPDFSEVFYTAIGRWAWSHVIPMIPHLLRESLGARVLFQEYM